MRIFHPCNPFGRGQQAQKDDILGPRLLKLVNGSGRGVAGCEHRIHGDHAPTGGRYPTPMWQGDEVVSDVWEHRVPLDAPRGQYDIFVSFYIGDERMPYSGGDKALHAGENRLRLGTMTVK